MASPVTKITGKTATLAQRLRSSGSETSIDIISTETPSYTTGSMKMNTGDSSEWIDFTGVTSNGGTSYTLTGVTRGINKAATSLTDASAGNKKDHAVGTVMKYVLHSSAINKFVQNDADNTLSGNNTISGTNTVSGSMTFTTTTVAGLRIPRVTTAQRDALTGTVTSAIIDNSTTGIPEIYAGGSWYPLATGSTQPNASTTVAGKVEIATAAEILAGTGTGGTGAILGISPDNLATDSVSSSAGAGDATKWVRLNSSGLVDFTMLGSSKYDSGTAGETLVADNWVYRKQSDGKLYKADNTTIEKATVVGVIQTGGATDATVYYIPSGNKWTTSGLTAGSTYYLSGTPGALTDTVPSHSSSSVIPVRIGVAGTTTVLDIQIQRIPRRLMTATTASVTGTTSITLGIPVSFVEAVYSIAGSYGGLTNIVTGSGVYDVVAGTQKSQFSRINITTPNNDSNIDASNMVSLSWYDGSGRTATGAGSIDGSNNLIITWTISGGSTSLQLTTVAFERI